MKDFIEKWNSDSRFKTKIKLGLYTLFVVIVSIFALSIRDDTNQTNLTDMDIDTNQNEQDIPTIEIPDKYAYIINIKINDNSYQYSGSKSKDKETITKVINDESINYIYQENNYYKEENGNYIITTKDEVYDIVGYNYLKLETINQYLSKSKEENETYIVYLKDIILGNDSEEYITITITEDKININYTSLMKLFDELVDSYLVEIVTDEIE